LEIQLYSPHQNQKKIHDSIISNNYKYYILNIGRQFGKSLLAENQICYWAANYPNSKIAWVSPIYKQAKKVFDEIERAFEGTPFFKSKNKQELYLECITGSTIQFFSAERYDNIRGFTFDYLVCDEFAFMDSEAWTEVLRATVLVRGKKVLLISTPKGKNHFYHLYQLDGINSQYKSFTMSSYDNPLINPSEIDDARATLPDHIFRQEYLAEFIDGGSGLFLNLPYEVNEPKGRSYGGLDLGRQDDYTALSIFNEDGQQIFCERWQHDTWANIISKVASVIDEYGAYTLVEVNSIGDALFETLQNKLKNPELLEPFVTTSNSKKDIIEGLIVANNEQKITLLPHDWLKKEFEIFTFEYNPKSRKVRYSAPSGFHDDGVMATVISYHSLKTQQLKGVYHIY
jgi:hypothetical protein